MALYSVDDIVNSGLKAGVALGLSWTPSGGEVMTVEVSRIPGGSGEVLLTGCLGDVLKESAKIALNWVRSVGHQVIMSTQRRI